MAVLVLQATQLLVLFCCAAACFTLIEVKFELPLVEAPRALAGEASVGLCVIVVYAVCGISLPVESAAIFL